MTNALTVADGMVVSLDYVLTLSDGEEIDSSRGQEPLVYLHGQGQIIPGLEKELLGMAVGDGKTVSVLPAEGYGDVDEDAIQLVPHNVFPDDLNLAAGLQVRMQTEEGHPLTAQVAEIRDDGVLLDFNHPLAGETLHFEVKIAALRPATSEELAHGHVHGPHGHHH